MIRSVAAAALGAALVFSPLSVPAGQAATVSPDTQARPSYSMIDGHQTATRGTGLALCKLFPVLCRP